MLLHHISEVVPSAKDLSHFIGDRTGASEDVARFIMYVVDWVLGIFGLDHNESLDTFLYTAVVLGISIVVGYVTQLIVLAIVRFVAKIGRAHV